MSAAHDYSLVVMTRNRPGPLARCLESIARLRRGPLRPEVVVVDDGSDPPARDVIERFPSLEVIAVTQPHRGVAAARNVGLARARGTFVAFIADDYVLPATYLEDVDAFFRDHPDAEVITHHIAPRGPALLRPVQQLYLDLVIGQEVPPGEAGPEVVRSFTLPASRAAVFRRRVFERVGLFDERLRVGEDGELARRLARAGIPVHLFLRKRILHHDARTSLDYFRQRIRYGRSYVRAGLAGPALQDLSSRRFAAAMLGRLRRQLPRWWEVSGRLGLRPRFLALAPFLLLFLALFYFGALLEFRAAHRVREAGRRANGT
ncbi:MAG: glycosyltransferase family 2 protein [Planctomycetes bacterium]|nr:glycosyltransferase family 2 protein [Planctomycetota bacterium]